ncbi:transcriptional regulator [Pseudomonas cavernicola]|uniref:Transcriptional regulator n=1 Tax=Pseudomonas cavernicola TaxID=2320866 RepID=A0A418XK34_9PSED|nr:transcriptional regulator [Pseudomonas cavernicola]RJG12801.1 transcriptional regulator [Pseudomonas cavernicola]
MARYVDDSQQYVSTATKTRRQQEDQRRMAYRRAIEDFAEQRRLQQELLDFPELIAANYLDAVRAASRRNARPAR